MARRGTLGLLVLLLLPVSAAPASDEPARAVAPLTEDERASLRDIAQKDAQRFSRLLSEAYELDEKRAADFEAECLARIDAEVSGQHDIRAAAKMAEQRWRDAIAKHGEDWLPSPAEIEELQRPVTQVANQLPLSVQSLQTILEKDLSSEAATAARERFAKLKEEDDKRMAEEYREKAEIEFSEKIEFHIKVEDQRRAEAELSPAGNPLPKEQPPPPPPIISPPPPPPKPKLEPAKPVEQHMTPPQPPGQPPARPAEPPPPPPPPLTPAPPIDEWDRHVDAVAAKYKFSTEQKGKAQGILKDLRDRARQYRKSRSADFEVAARMQPGPDRSAEEKRLSEPLDELFAELKERLENLPTQEQREAAGGAPKK